MMNPENKAAFAAFLLESPADPFKAAQKLCPDNTGVALWVATNWANDPEVMTIVNGLKGDPKNLSSIASKYDLARLYWDMAQDTKLDAKDRIAAAEKFGAVAEYYDPKANKSTTVNIDNAPRVMVVKDFGSETEWREAAKNQQRELVNGRYAAKQSTAVH